MSIGEKLRELRQKKGLSQEELAKAVQVSQPWISQIERGTKILTVPLAKELASFFQCSVVELIGEEEGERRKEIEK
mgnify:CR=1 FL=1